MLQNQFITERNSKLGQKTAENLKKRFGNLQNSIIKLFLETQNPEIKKYCSTTAELLKKISEKEITYLMTKCTK